MKTTKVKKVFKFATGDVIPEGATYLGSLSQDIRQDKYRAEDPSWLAWHYFLVEVDDD